ncbi:MAG TPA: FAD-dependent oxidoreductase [Candidatus Binatia bacterium]|nr:FAD-dependent oxidoreductase [Candidatus Binatia bacterium]
MAELTILGGGPAGLGVAYYATRAGQRVALYEKSTALGGLCRTLQAGAHRYDTGAHRFHDRDPDVTRDVRELVGDDLRSVDAPSQICDRGRFVDFPPTPLNLLLSSSVGDAGRIGLEILRGRLARRAPVSFGDFAVRQFGETLARRYLLAYSEKLWGLPAHELSPDVATRRLSGMTIGSLVRELVAPGRKTRHIDGRFLYPRLGYGQIADRLTAALPAAAINAGRAVVGLECAQGRVARIRFADGAAVEPGDRVVSTLPLTVLVKLLGDAAPADARRHVERLRFRHIRLVFLRLAQERVSPNASIYVPDPSLIISRISEPKNRSAEMAPPDETSLVVEVPCFTGDAVHGLSDGALVDRVVSELERLGLVRPDAVLETHVHFLPHAYPVYALDFGATVARVLDALAGIENLDTLGRGGRFVYGHLHDQLGVAKEYVARRAAAA